MGKTRVIALVVASLVSAASFAGAQAPAPSAQSGRHSMGRGMQAGVRGERGMLHGLKLSDAEKAKLKDIHGKYAAQSKSLRDSMKPAMNEARAARQKGDTAAARAVLVRNKGTYEKLQAIRTSEQAEIRGALSPENQKQFDANVAKRRADRKANGRGGRHANQRAGVKG
jgi:Spy/CpxP family protein refolding chaperone